VSTSGCSRLADGSEAADGQCLGGRRQLHSCFPDQMYRRQQWSRRADSHLWRRSSEGVVGQADVWHTYPGQRAVKRSDPAGQAYLSENRRYRKLTGASILKSRKNGLLKRSSRVLSSCMSVSTQCSRHLLVTKSRRLSTSGKVRPRVPFSSVTDGRRRFSSSKLCPASCSCEGRWRRRKPWC
jgi:hypothetical protein